MTIEHSMQLTDLVEEYGVAGVVRELQQIVIETEGEGALHELGGEYSGLLSITVNESLEDVEI